MMIATSSITNTMPAPLLPRQGVVLPDASGSVDRVPAASPSPVADNQTVSASTTDNTSLQRVPAGNSAEQTTQEDNPESLKARLEAEQQQADQQLIQQLRARDREVRTHEQAHAAVGGRYAGTPQYEFKRGPDGAQYAVGGEVSISTSKVSGDPQATLEKARVIRAAALAPAEPSAQDRRVAAKASQMEIEARVEIQEVERAERQQQAEAAEQREEEITPEDEAASAADRAADARPELPELPLTQAAGEDQSAGPAASGDEAEQGEAEGETSGQNDRETARESLERILLAGKTVSQQLNEMGLVDPENPYGKSGLIEFIV